MSSTRVAVVQAGSVLSDWSACVEKAARLIGEAARDGARLIVFPEAFIGGYPKGADFGARVGSRSAQGREEFRLYWENAIEVPGPATARLGQATREHEVWLAIGAIERDGSTLYCTVLFFSPDGKLTGKHRKLMPTAMERLIWGCGDGSTLPVFETGFGRMGAVICWENYMPLLRAAMYAKGVQLYCAPTVDDRETWLPTLRHIALEGRCYVLSACQFVRGATEAQNINGGSAIVGPSGEILAGPLGAGEGILTAAINLDRIPEGKFDLDVVGHYARPDVFHLEVNESVLKSVQFGAKQKPAED